MACTYLARLEVGIRAPNLPSGTRPGAGAAAATGVKLSVLGRIVHPLLGCPGSNRKARNDGSSRYRFGFRAGMA